MLRGATLVLLTACCAGLSQTPKSSTQYSADQQVTTGDLLVASEKLGDPHFAETVVLVLEHDDDKGTLGVIINRRSELPLSRVFPDIKGASADPVYVGGPVSLTAVQALLRSPEKSDDVRPVSGDIYATGSKEIIEKSVRSRTASSKFRLYVGYAGWAPGQLQMEIKIGAWTVLSNRTKLTFDEDPESLWSRLTHESHMQIAAAKPSPEMINGYLAPKISAISPRSTGRCSRQWRPRLAVDRRLLRSPDHSQYCEYDHYCDQKPDQVTPGEPSTSRLKLLRTLCPIRHVC